ncbi:S-adenosyl-L-methionine-dependent methyltransferase [Chloropicon primus]|uniref:S-adenosyl-L-methionine-dependent methyltransferase n=1 Tax=Chloropicon primus TaxID=1764295 RepID=A0A5B8MND1_9CHLO|nr:S-adenosyl-L-methionine-dependent methyltransferase [Chloropicon primus]UPR01128.1 S-adenosyl-L-methionine-dependent methyltransferase [Chloropicon primus]|eukprot:QDZ21907.1 S-adenosyl-L-methionine-dependent methyltransferase [Chloropicon primus]
MSAFAHAHKRKDLGLQTWRQSGEGGRKWPVERKLPSAAFFNRATRKQLVPLSALQAEKPGSLVSVRGVRGERQQKPEQTVRSLVLAQLLRVEDKGAYAALATGAPSSESRPTDTLSAQDRRDVTRLVSEILRWKRKLDHIIDGLNGDYHRRGASKDGRRGKLPKPFDSRVRQILRMGAYELYFAQKPAYVVNEYVNLAKGIGNARKAAGLINSLLRKVTMYVEEEYSTEDFLAMERAELVEVLGNRHSHPNWLIDRWLTRFGLEDCLDLLEYNNARPRYCLRTNPCHGLDTEEMKRKAEAAGVEFSETSYLEDFIVIEKGLQKVFSAGLMQDRLCSVQDISAGLVVDLMDPKAGEEVLDVCAAPGGKFYYAAARMNYEGKLVALDASRNRMRALENGIRRFPDSLVTETHSVAFEAWSAENEGVLFDKVLVDAPCSGTGVLAKRADLRWRREAEDLQELTEIQSRLLNHAKNHVKVGGILCYSTCSIEEEENSGRIMAFLRENPEFEVEEMPGTLDVKKDGFLQTFPHQHKIDGAFAARLVKRK